MTGRYVKPYERTTNKIWIIKKRIVLERDNYSCKGCGSFKNLEVHHIVPRKRARNLELEEDNMITLCHKCHEIADKEALRRKR